MYDEIRAGHRKYSAACFISRGMQFNIIKMDNAIE